MAGGTDGDQFAPSVVDDKEDAEYAEGDGGDRKEVHRGDDLAVVGEKGPPSLLFVGMSWVPGHVARDCAFGDLEAELLDLAVDAWRAPRRILGGHPASQGSDLGQGQPEDSIGRAETRSRALPSEDGELLSEREVLQDQVGPAGDSEILHSSAIR
jgi:hypothetical protein